MLALGVISSGVFAGLAAILVTVAIERLGGVLGGILATLPTTIVPASVGLFYELGADHVPAAMYAVPVGMLVDVFFLLCWRTLLPRVPNEWSTLKQIGVMVAVTLTVWVVLAVIVAVFLDVVLQSPGALALAGTGALLSSGCTGVIACLHPPASPKGTNAVSRAMLAARGVCAGVAVSTAVMLSDLSGVVGGIFSVFPAIFFTTMVGLWISQGDGVPLGAIGPMVLGSTSVGLYALLFGALAPSVGPWAAACICWLSAASLASVPAYYYVRWRSTLSERFRKASVPDLDDFDLVLQDCDSGSDAGALSGGAWHMQPDSPGP